MTHGTGGDSANAQTFGGVNIVSNAIDDGKLLCL